MAHRRKFICGNWKLHNTVAESRDLAQAVRQAVEAMDGDRRPLVGVAPGFLSLPAVSEVLAGGPVILAAQNGYWEPEGAFTGEVSFAQLQDVGCSHVILGHSERRHVFGESDEFVARKVRGALDAGMNVILCVGELLEERDAGQQEDVVRRQVESALGSLSAEHMGRVVVAYEPVWAIGTGRTASPEQAQQMHAFIRKVLADGFGSEQADKVVIQYGGSVKPGNAAALMAQPDVDGALVGGAALRAEDFAGILQAVID